MIPGLTVVKKPFETYLIVREADGDRELTAAECQALFDSAKEVEHLRLRFENIKSHLDGRLNDHLCEMKEGWHDSVVGFNEAWDIVRQYFKEVALAVPTPNEEAYLADIERRAVAPDPKTVVGGPR